LNSSRTGYVDLHNAVHTSISHTETDRNRSHVEIIEYVYYAYFKDHIYAKVLFTLLLDKVMNEYVPTLWKLLIQEKHIKS